MQFLENSLTVCGMGQAYSFHRMVASYGLLCHRVCGIFDNTERCVVNGFIINYA